jgi:CTP:molybdopterin cytidylyltransferase MocA
MGNDRRRHRDDVRQAVDELHLPEVAALSLQVVQELRSRQVQSVEINPGVSGHSTATPSVFDRDVKEAVRQLVGDRGLEQFGDAPEE